MTCITLHRRRQRVKPAVRLTDRGPSSAQQAQAPSAIDRGASFKVLLVLVMAMTMLVGLLGGLVDGGRLAGA